MNPFDLAQSATESDRTLTEVSPVYGELAAIATVAQELSNNTSLPDHVRDLGEQAMREQEVREEAEQLRSKARGYIFSAEQHEISLAAGLLTQLNASIDLMPSLIEGEKYRMLAERYYSEISANDPALEQRMLIDLRNQSPDRTVDPTIDLIYSLPSYGAARGPEMVKLAEACADAGYSVSDRELENMLSAPHQVGYGFEAHLRYEVARARGDDAMRAEVVEEILNGELSIMPQNCIMLYRLAARFPEPRLLELAHNMYAELGNPPAWLELRAQAEARSGNFGLAQGLLNYEATPAMADLMLTRAEVDPTPDNRAQAMSFYYDYAFAMGRDTEVKAAKLMLELGRIDMVEELIATHVISGSQAERARSIKYLVMLGNYYELQARAMEATLASQSSAGETV